MNILFDTNVVIDLFTDTDDFKAAFTAVDVALLRDFKLWLPACSTPSIRYLLTARKLMKAADARRAFGDLLQLFSIADTTSADCLAAYEHEHRDFEKSPVPVLSPTEFVDLFKPADIVYGWETLPPE